MSEFIADEKGATAIEYGLIAAFIFLVIMTSLVSVGERLTEVFTSVSTGL